VSPICIQPNLQLIHYTISLYILIFFRPGVIVASKQEFICTIGHAKVSTIVQPLNQFFFLFVNDMASSSSSAIDIVISRYAEKIDWLNSPPISTIADTTSSSNHHHHRTRIYVYNKGEALSNITPDEYLSILSLENVGRECHTFLHHIISHYDNLAEVTLFLPGSCMDASKRDKTNKLISKVLETRKSVFFGQYFRDVYRDLHSFGIDHWSGSNQRNQSSNPSLRCRPASMKPFGKWYKHYFPDVVISAVCWHSIFAVSKEDILQHPITYYENLISCLSDHPNPEEGHFLERSWLAVFHPVSESSVYTTKPIKAVERQAAPSMSSQSSSFKDILSKFKSSAPVTSVKEETRKDEESGKDDDDGSMRKKAKVDDENQALQSI
jgi:hypothetical protein